MQQSANVIEPHREWSAFEEQIECVVHQRDVVTIAKIETAGGSAVVYERSRLQEPSNILELAFTLPAQKIEMPEGRAHYRIDFGEIVERRYFGSLGEAMTHLTTAINA